MSDAIKAIPVKSISFDPDTDTWGLIDSRTFKRDDTEVVANLFWTQRF